jgi:hypothetical protein
MQIRYIASLIQKSRDGSPGAGEDDEDEGFQIRRAKIGFEGHVEAGRKWNYGIVLAASYNGIDQDDTSHGPEADANVYAEDIWVSTQVADGLTIKAGKFKLPFLRGELTSSKHELAVERGSVTEVFTLDRAEQIQLQYQPMDAVKLMVSISDGANSGTGTIGADNVEFAITARADVLLAGEWGQMNDTSAWEGEPFAAFIGAAVHYQMGDDPNGDVDTENDGDFFAWTVDGSIETNGLGVAAAFMGQHSNYDDDFGASDYDLYGASVEASYFVIADKLQPFVRFEWMTIDLEDASSEDIDDALLLTVGGNYYFDKHNAKFTLDMVWWIDGDLPTGNGNSRDSIGGDPVSSGLGFASGDEHSEDALLVRAQFQLLF